MTSRDLRAAIAALEAITARQRGKIARSCDLAGEGSRNPVNEKALVATHRDVSRTASPLVYLRQEKSSPEVVLP